MNYNKIKPVINLKLFYRVVLLLLFTRIANAQQHEFKYQRPLNGITDTWHRIDIPTDAFSKLNNDFSDIRIIGILSNGDTIETPYLLKVEADSYDNQEINFNLINEVNNSSGFYYTFEILENQAINSIDLAFNKLNFDWYITLEGSQNQQEWFTILDQSRILGIENNNTSYNYTELHFKNVNYKYLRLKIPTSKNPQFKKATMEEKRITKGRYISPKNSMLKIVENNDKNTTQLFLNLHQTLPISYINVVVTDSIDFYRPISVEYAIDSIENNTGWQYLYKHLFNATLSSLNKSGYNFSNYVLNRLKITVYNADNEPLNYKKIELHGNPYYLVARFTKPASYKLVYGNSNAYVPNYDITKFEDNIPTHNKILDVGDETVVVELSTKEPEPLFKDDLWLWSIMVLSILILGWFSIKMLKK